MFRYVTRTVLILSLVSLFADIASEMLYPVMPIYLEQIGFGALLIGIWEGLAQFISGLGKAFFGSLSDEWNRRNIFIRSGYLLSAIGKPVMGLFPNVPGVFGGRSLDRLGKGMRGAARDAVLIAESSPEDRGKVFGFHRAMDTLGAVIGPLITLVLLWIYPGQYQWLFLLAFAPGIISFGISLLLPGETGGKAVPGKSKPFRGIFGFWKSAPTDYKRLTGSLILFMLLNSSDLFIILRGKEVGIADVHLIGAFILYNIVYAVSSLPAGMLADKLGFKPVFMASILIYAGVYLGLSFQPGPGILYAFFGLYGVFAASHDSIAKAWLSQYIPSGRKATGMGLFQFLGTFARLLASPILGLIWIKTDGHTAFGVIGLCAGGLFFLLFLLLPKTTPGKDS